MTGSAKQEEEVAKEEDRNNESSGVQRVVGGDKVKPVRGFHRVLPLAGSGKIPWLRLLMTDDLGES